MWMPLASTSWGTWCSSSEPETLSPCSPSSSSSSSSSFSSSSSSSSSFSLPPPPSPPPPPPPPPPSPLPPPPPPPPLFLLLLLLLLSSSSSFSSSSSSSSSSSFSSSSFSSSSSFLLHYIYTCTRVGDVLQPADSGSDSPSGEGSLQGADSAWEGDERQTTRSAAPQVQRRGTGQQTGARTCIYMYISHLKTCIYISLGLCCFTVISFHFFYLERNNFTRRD